MLNRIQQLIWRFQQTNEKACYLAFLRVAVSIWFLKELYFRKPAFELLYSNKSFFTVQPTPSIALFRLDAVWLKDHYLYIIGACVLLLLLNIAGIGRNMVAILLFLAFTVLYNINNQFGNGGDEMSLLLLFYLSLADTYGYFTVFKSKPLPVNQQKLRNLLSNLAAYSLLINLCMVYFMAGLFKLVEPFWQNGTALHYFFNDQRYSVFTGGSKHVDFPNWLLYIFNYGTIVLELCFPVLVFDKRFRNVALLLCLLMHFGIYSFLMIYGMSLIFVIQYGIFYSNDEVKAAAQKIKSVFGRLFTFAVK